MNRTVAVLLVLSSMAASALAQTPLRVACIGDSITYGDKLSARDVQSYPAVLERLARERFAVGNFGVNGATALQTTGRAWTDTAACRDALAFAPDLVVVMLGINDLAFPDRAALFPADLRAIVERFQALSPSPRVYLCTLTPLAPEERQAHANRAIRDIMNPAIRAVAADVGATVVDVSAAFPNREELLPDGLHPSPEGAGLIARAVLAALDAPSAPSPQIQPAPVAGPVDVSIRHEARAAQNRAERWLERQPPPAHLRDPAAEWTGRDLRSPGDVAHLLPLLDGTIPDNLGDPLYSFAALAIALDRIGHETVFLAGNRPIAWREALLRQLVVLQDIEADGSGCWPPPGRKANRATVVETTAYALRALATALGE